MNKLKRNLLSFLTISLLVLQMMSPITVFADGETPPETPATEEVPPPEESTDTTEENPVEEPPSTDEEEIPEDSMAESALPSDDSEEAITEETTQPDESEETETSPGEESDLLEEPLATEEALASDPTSEPASAPEETQPEEAESPEDLTVAEVLEQAPAGTEVVVIDEGGQIEPLATETAAEITANADPIWCPNGVTPQDNSGGCSPSFTYASYNQPLVELINWLRTYDPDADGTIWIEKDYDSDAEGVDTFTLNGNAFNNLNSHTLTIQGGWNGLGTTTVEDLDPSTFTGDSLRVVNWDNDVTINNIFISNTANPGLQVTTTGHINLNYVTVQGATGAAGDGARLRNDGVDGKDVTVKNSTFSSNTENGLRVVSNGNITLADVIASGNGNRGALINNTGGSGYVYVQNSIFSNNPTSHGLQVASNGNITLDDVTASGNGSRGALLNNSDGSEDVYVKVQNSIFSENKSFGLSVNSKGDIILEEVKASENTLRGATLDNSAGNGTITLNSSKFIENPNFGLVVFSSGPVNGDNLELNKNGRNGMELYSDGAVTLTGITANLNGWDGIYARIWEGTLTITDSTLGGDLATGNGDDGLDAIVEGNVTLKNVTAIGNFENGAKVYAGYYEGEGGPVPSGPGDLTVSDSTFSQNVDTGFKGYTDTGNFNFLNVNANQNGEFGLDLEANEGAINLTNTFANQNDWFGLWLAAWDNDIILNNVTANTNGIGGADLETDYGNINVSNSQFNSNGSDAVPYCESGSCEFDLPDGVGLTAANWEGVGQILVNNVQASNNYGDGTILFGDDVLVYNSIFNNNGMYVFEPGINALYADGLYIEDMGGSSAYLECVQANNNAAYGIEIITGDIILNGITATGNGWDNTYFESNTLTNLDNPCRDIGRGSRKTSPDTLWKTVQVAGGENIGLDCSIYAGTILVLPNGDEIRLPCPTTGEAKLSPLADNALPGDLPAGNNYVSALTAEIINGEISFRNLPTAMIVSFVIPEDMLDIDLAILYWNGSEWIEVPGAYFTADGRFEVAVNYTGDFMLVSK